MEAEEEDELLLLRLPPKKARRRRRNADAAMARMWLRFLRPPLPLPSREDSRFISKGSSPSERMD